jgi:hypothetical protein
LPLENLLFSSGTNHCQIISALGKFLNHLRL